MGKDNGFGERLQILLDERKMTRADLAREVYGVFTDERGYEVAKNRQAIGKYISGKTKPTDSTKRLIAEALKVSFSELDPASDPLTRAGSGISVRQVDRKNSLIDLQIVVPTKDAPKVIAAVARYAR